MAQVDAAAKKTAATTNAASTAMGSRLSRAAKIGGQAVGVGLAYGLYKGVKAGIDFEKQMDAVGSVANANAKEMKQLEKQALKLGQSTAFSANEVAGAQEQLVKGGLRVKDVIGGALKASLTLAAAGQMDLAEASATTVNAMKLFELRAKDAGKVADMLATAANTTTADVEDFAMALRQGGSAAKAAGLDMNETITILEALAEAGIKNSDAGTSMKTALLQLIAPTETQAAKAKELGLNFIAANGELKNASGISRELRDALGGMTKSQQAANLKVLAGTDGFRTLSALYDAGPAKLDKLSRANERQGTAQEIAKEKMDNTAGSLEQLQGAFETLSIKLFKSAEGPFRDAIDGATERLQEFTRIVTSKKLTSSEKITKVFDMISDILQDVIPDVISVAVRIGAAIAKGIAHAFIHGDILTKLFIGAAGIRLFGGAGVFSRLGQSILSKMFGGLALKLGLGTAAGKAASSLTAPGMTPARPLFVSVVNGGLPDGGGGKPPVPPVIAGGGLGALAALGGAGGWAAGMTGLVVALDSLQTSKMDRFRDSMDGLIASIRGGTVDAKEFRDAAKELEGMGSDPIVAMGGSRGAVADLNNSKERFGEIIGEMKAHYGSLRNAADSMSAGTKRSMLKFIASAHDAGQIGDKQFKRLAMVFNTFDRSSRRDMDSVGDTLKEGGADLRLFGTDAERFMEKSRREMRRFEEVVDSVKGRVGDDLKDMGRDVLNFADKADRGSDNAGDSFKDLSAKAKKSFQQVGANLTNLASTVTSGLDIIISNTNKALKGFGVKKIAIALTNVGDAAKGFQKGGVLVPGQGDGDKVPAMLEPGEVVLNKKAVAAMGGARKANAINQAIPRFAKGGVAGNDLAFALGPYSIPPIEYDPDHAAGNSHWHISANSDGPWIRGIGEALQRMGFMVGEHPAFGGVQSSNHGHYGASDHYHGGALDVNSAADETRAETAKVAALISGGGVAGAVAEKIKRILLEGPDGPLKDLGQSALDKVRDAANKYIASKTPNDPGVGAMGKPIKSLPDALKKYNRLYPEEHGWGGYQMPVDAVAALAEWAGAPGVTFAQIAKGESNYRPGAVGSDAEAGYGNTFGYGLWQITSGVGNESLVGKYGGFDQMLNPVLNAQVTGEMYRAGGTNPWVGTSYVTDWNAHYTGNLLKQKGGIVQKLAKGGIVQDLVGVIRKGDKDRTKRQLKKFTKDMRDFGVPEKLIERLTTLRHDADKYGEYAANASSLSEDGVLGMFQGATEAQWTTKQLDALFKLRNRLIAAKKIIEKRIREQAKMLDKAEKQLKKTNKAINAADKDRKDLVDRLDAAKKAKDKKLVAELEKKLDSYDERQDIRKELAAKLKSPIISTLKAVGGRLKNGDKFSRTLIEEGLTTVQGIDGPRRKLAKLPPIGILGGEIFDAQLRLKQLGEEANVTDSGLDLAGLRDVIEAARYGVFDGMETFHTGGVVPGTGERPVKVLGGEGIFTAEQMAAMGKGTTVEVTNNISVEGMDLVIETLIDGKLAKRERREHLLARQYR